MTAIQTTIFPPMRCQKLSIGASESFRCNASHQRQPSEPKGLPDSPEEPPAVYPGNLPGHFIKITLEKVHDLKRGDPAIEEEECP